MAVFVAVSLIGASLTGFYLYSIWKDMSLLINANESLQRRIALADATARLRKLSTGEPLNLSGRIAAAGTIETFLINCNGCHHSIAGQRAVADMMSLVNSIRKVNSDAVKSREFIDGLASHAHDALLAGQMLVRERSKRAHTYIKITSIAFIVSIFFGLGGLILISLYFMRKFESNIDSMLEATDALRRGEKVNIDMFVKDFRKVGYSMEMMQRELMIKEEKLVSWARQWQTAFDAVDLMMALCDNDGSVTVANRAFNNMFGADEDITGRNMEEIVCRKDRHGDGFSLKSTLRDGMVYSEIIKDNGMTLEVKTFPVISGDGVIKGVLWIGRDITRERDLEERAVQSEKLVALGELVAGIAHEINNPLSSVVGFAEMLRDSREVKGKVRNKIEKIYLAAMRISRIIRNLLEFSRKKPVEISKNNLNEIAEKILELKEYELNVENIDLVRDFSEIPLILCDWTQVQQIILNLLNNAEQAILEKGGKGIIGLKTYSDDENAYLEISDNGPGITDEIKNRIFEPFFTTKDVGKGTGLGLAIVYSSVKSHGGEIKIASTPGEGTTFTVSFPVNKRIN